MTYYGSSIANADSIYDNSDYAMGYVDTYTDEQDDGMLGYSTWDGGDIVRWRYTATDSTITIVECDGDPCVPESYHYTYEISDLTLTTTNNVGQVWEVSTFRRQ